MMAGMKTSAFQNPKGNKLVAGPTPLDANRGTPPARFAPIASNQTGVSLRSGRPPETSTEADSFFAEPVDPRQEAQALASEALRRLLIWMADGRTLEERGLRACVALFCIRPDLIDGATLDAIGDQAGRSRQAVHKLAVSFRETTGLEL
jgi:hypothetical protein